MTWTRLHGINTAPGSHQATFSGAKRVYRSLSQAIMLTLFSASNLGTMPWGRAGAALPFTSHTGGTPWNRKTPGLWIRRMTTSQSTSDRYSGETRSTLRIWQGENGTVDHEARKSAGKDGPGMLDQRRFCSFPFLVVKKHKGLSISSPSAHP